MKQVLHHIFIESKIAKMNLVCVHGLLGSSNNFRSILKNKNVNDQVSSYCIDLRNHGKSFHASSMTSLDMAEDLYNFIISQNLKNFVFMGHSLGGIVVSTLVSNFPDIWDLCKGVILIDISPENPHLSREKNEIRKILQNLAFYQTVGKSYKQVKQEILEICEGQQDVAGLVMTNVKGNEETGYTWGSNIYALHHEYDSYINSQVKHVCPLKLKLIYGKDSRYIYKGIATGDMFSRFYSNFNPSEDFVGIGNAGHWVHAQQPYEFISVLSSMLSDLSK